MGHVVSGYLLSETFRGAARCIPVSFITPGELRTINCNP
jgi:hypothetical protein